MARSQESYERDKAKKREKYQQQKQQKQESVEIVPVQAVQPKTINQKVSKSRNWAFIVYPESAVDNWRDMIAQTGLPFAVSPLHDADVNGDQSEKKSHWHVLVCYAGPTSINVVKQVTEPINATIPQVVHNLRGYYRYFTHKDNPEKAQYLETAIELYNGFQPPDFTLMTASEKFAIKRRIISIIEVEEIYEYSILVDYLLSQDDLEQEAFYATNNTMFFIGYLSSRRHRLQSVMKSTGVDENFLYKHEKMPSIIERALKAQNKANDEV